jgi:predicted Zn-dependent peptidase
MEFFTHKLENGIRLIHQSVVSPVAHSGIIINTGSRDEIESQHGMAHFIEHLIFKGTKKRRAHHILSRMEDVGGEINAYTTKEETCIHTIFFKNYYARTFELLADIVFNSTFPEKEIHKEKEVIIDEINSYKDSPYEEIYDNFEELIFNSNPIARNILGTEKSLHTYNRSHLVDFYMNNYPTTEMVVASVSSVPYKKVLECFIKFFTDKPVKIRAVPRLNYDSNLYSAIKQKTEHDTYQAHCLIGNQAYSNHEEKRLALHLINNLLGGTGMNSRLNMTLREKKGLAYNVESNYSTYSDYPYLLWYG